MSANHFAQQVNEYIRAKAELFAPLTSHTSITGAGRENVLREFVNDLLPRRYEALTGTLAPAPSSNSGRSQVDLMVVNTQEYPVLVRDGVLAVVLPQAVQVIVEIKTNLDAKDKLGEALCQIRRTHRLVPAKKPPLSILFSYGYPASPDTLFKNLSEAIQDEAQKAMAKPEIGEDSDELGPWQALDLPNFIIASGAGAGTGKACIAAIEPVNLNKSTADPGFGIDISIFEIKPSDTISFLLNKILGEITPKPTRSRDSFQTEAWTWVKSYFDVRLGKPVHSETIRLPTQERR
ncbi:MAG: hypothetical protein HC927_05105 [Deltaproteobacteria bacterium]|nr:hypothetical protein [Deltaproteobacteria bacterium]